MRSCDVPRTSFRPDAFDFSLPNNLQIGSLASCRGLLDIRLVRETPDAIRKDLAKRHAPDKERLLDSVIQWDKEWRKALAEGDALKRRRNEITKEIAEAKKAGKSTDKLRKEAAELPMKIAALDGRIDELAGKVRDGLLRLPNPLHDSVPVGKDDTENVEVARWGTPRKVDFELRPHGELLEALRLADFERGRKIAGAGFVYLLGDLVRLDQALLSFALDYMVKQGFTAVFPPFLMRRAAYEGVVDLTDFENVMYKIDGEDIYLIATSEHPIGAMFMDEVIEAERLPLLLTGLATQFRREMRGHGGHRDDRREEVRHRGVVSAAEGVPRSDQLQQLHGLPGPPTECPGGTGRGREVPAPHPERHGDGDLPRARCDPGELPELRRELDGPEGLTAVPW